MATSSFHAFLYSCQKFTFCRTYLTVFFHFVLSYACFSSKLPETFKCKTAPIKVNQLHLITPR